MRVVGGSLGRRVLNASRGDRTRPTTDRARESLFNVLSNLVDWDGLAVLDLFAGTGAIGIEALSRGAASAVFVECDRHALTALKKNIAELRIADATLVRAVDAFAFLETTAMEFDLIFADAPYEEVRARTELVESAFRRSALKENGMLIVEHRTGDHVTQLDGVRVLRELSAGEASFTILGR